MKKILVIGASGFIGGYLTRQLVAEGNQRAVAANLCGTGGFLLGASTEQQTVVKNVIKLIDTRHLLGLIYND